MELKEIHEHTCRYSHWHSYYYLFLLFRYGIDHISMLLTIKEYFCGRNDIILWYCTHGVAMLTVVWYWICTVMAATRYKYLEANHTAIYCHVCTPYFRFYFGCVFFLTCGCFASCYELPVDLPGSLPVAFLNLSLLLSFASSLPIIAYLFPRSVFGFLCLTQICLLNLVF